MEDYVDISEVEIVEYLYTNLSNYGYVPSVDELFDLAAIFFDYLMDKGVIESITIDGEEDE